MEPVTLALAATLLWRGSTEIAAGPAERGPWQQNESHYRYVDDATVAVDARGRVAFAWVDQATKDVHFGKQGGAVNVSRSPQTFSWLPRVAIGADGVVYVLWQEIIFSGGSHGGDILFARSQDGGATFSAPLNLSASVAGDGKGRIDKDRWHNGSLDVAVGSDGTVFTAWTEYEGALWLRRSIDGGKSFSGKVRLPDAKPARAPALAVHGNTVYLAWTVGDDRSADKAPDVCVGVDPRNDEPEQQVDAGEQSHAAERSMYAARCMWSTRRARASCTRAPPTRAAASSRRAASPSTTPASPRSTSMGKATSTCYGSASPSIGSWHAGLPSRFRPTQGGASAHRSWCPAAPMPDGTEARKAC